MNQIYLSKNIIYRPIHNQTLNITWRSISKILYRVIRQPASLCLDSLIVTSSRVFSLRLFPRTYQIIYQSSSTQITSWTHCFNQVTLITHIPQVHPNLFRIVFLCDSFRNSSVNWTQYYLWGRVFIKRT